MQLKLAYHPIEAIRFDSRTALDGATLSVDQAELRRLVLEDFAIESVDFVIAAPNESLRAGPVFDIVEPRAKAPDGSPDWPGILGAPLTAGNGTTHVLSGAAGAAAREDSSSDSRGATGYILEMSCEGAAVSYYSSLHHLTALPDSKAGLTA